MTQYRPLARPEIRRHLLTLAQAAKGQEPGGLRAREYYALRLGIQAVIDGREAEFAGKRLTNKRHDLSDCAEIKLAVVPEMRRGSDLGPSHRLIYREFEAEDGGLPYREVVAFAHRGNDRPFEEAAARLNRREGVRLQSFRPTSETAPPAPIRQALPPDIRAALAAAGDVASARGAVTPPTTNSPAAGPRRGDPPERGR
ncbi:hypothetical protein HPO96_34125 [Kribbella sandramycini]|uniref:Uncharacterized protein n=1 Tax=Kribbella sandramycini TaxID=60450 RepID=A0A7Y4L6N4_9ACTN|nr:hypothetical protein [Kribbella sandramycini]MBB6570438.1 hypothetical protein [Kribbella sandramycini]NOL45298.1 hypothetical protein [Kribbella sandramycini]